jgi:hypothetical protein
MKRTFDFRKRVDGDEIVFQTTIAPAGSPEWATDPLELWNRAEQAERRKDAQVARDYRVPLPLGLSDPDICAMALDIARYISQKLTTPVSIGVHRDAPVTAFGEAKSAAQRGCHAHLYFPTRKLLLDEAAAEDGKAGGTGMGEKLSFLSNKSTAGFFVDDINKFWAEAANRYTLAAGLTSDFDHRSYRRMGIKVQPQPRLGEAVTAMQREGRETRRGAHVREVKAMSEVYRQVLSHQNKRPRGPFLNASAPPAASVSTAAPGLRDSIRFATAKAATSAHQESPSPNQIGTTPLSLTERFRQLYFVGLEEGDRPEQTLIFRLVALIERTMARMRRVGSDRMDLMKEKAQAQTASLDAKADLADWQAGARRAELEASSKATVWERMAQGVGSWMNPADPIEVRRRALDDAEVEHRLNARVVTTDQKVRDLVEQFKPLNREGREQRAQFRGALRDLDAAHEAAIPQLLAVSWEEERDWIERFWPELLGPVPNSDEGRRGEGRTGPAIVTPRVRRGRVL